MLSYGNIFVQVATPHLWNAYNVPPGGHTHAGSFPAAPPSQHDFSEYTERYMLIHQAPDYQVFMLLVSHSYDVLYEMA